MKTILLFEFKCLFKSDLSLSGAQIRLIADEEDLHVGGAGVADLLQPLGEALEAVPPAHRVRQDGGMRAPIEDLGDGAERLLACGVPDLQLEYLVLDTDEVGAKLHSHRHVMVLLELVLHQALQHARLADA